MEFADNIQKRLNECQLELNALRRYANKLEARLDEFGVNHDDIAVVDILRELQQ